MKLAIYSDLHLEICGFLMPPSAFNAEVIVLAGDIGVGLKGVEWASALMSRTKAHIVYVAGNHEFYGYDIEGLRRSLRRFCGPPSGWTGDTAETRLHFLDNDEVVINGTRFLGCSLWTDFTLFGEERRNESILECEGRLNDFRLIRKGGSRFRAMDSIDLHQESVEWLERKLRHEPFGGPTIVVTHHAPSVESVVPRFAQSLTSAAFASKLERLLGFSELWIHGHMHEGLDYMENGTRVICNPRGYVRREDVGESDAYRRDLLVEI